ncbi:hypothetical protein ACS0PU_002664 [Formica fusca]
MCHGSLERAGSIVLDLYRHEFYLILDLNDGFYPILRPTPRSSNHEGTHLMDYEYRHGDFFVNFRHLP